MPDLPTFPPSVRIETRASITDPAVSVIMPNLNKGDFIGESIESVLAQSMGNFELLIVDDASTDGSFEIARRYAQKETRITLIRKGATEGVSAARNIGIRFSRGQFVGFLDSDDMYAPSKLDRQLMVLKQSKTPVVSYCDYWQIDETGAVLPPSRFPVYKESGDIFGDVLADKFGIKTTTLLSRECLLEMGPFDESLPFSEDLDMILRLSRSYQFAYLDEKLYSYRVFSGNTRNRLPETTLSSTRALVIEKHFKTSKSILTPLQRRQVILILTKHFRKSSQRGKMIHYGLSSPGSFRYMVTEPIRGRGLRRLFHPIGPRT